ncbi:MAG TPA: YfiR family protein [Salinivirgaceae bacterium]|nr:YfiR family protein [Salinivirgaceae bacterium]
MAQSLRKILIILIFSGLTYYSANSQQFTEYEVKAGYLYNFARFVTWPVSVFADATTPIVIGIYGNPRSGEIIKATIRNNTIDGRPFVIKYYNKPNQIQQCHILFVTEITRSQVIELIKEIKGKPILTVGDNIPEFCQLGGIVNFTQQYSTKRFEINHQVAIKSDLIISSKLLTLAQIVVSNEVEF